MIKYSALLLLVLIQLGCKNDDECEATDPIPELFYLTFEDGAGNNLLGTEGFDPNGMILFRGAFEDIPRDQTGEAIAFSYSDLLDETDYYLRVNKSDIDTLQVTLVDVEGRCFTVKKINSFQYNGVSKVIENSTPNFTIIKN